MYDLVLAKDGQSPVIDSRWVEHWKGEIVRNRLVARELAGGDERLDVFAATAGRRSVKLVVSRASTTRKCDGHTRRAPGIFDFCVAFFHADLDEDLCLRLPKGLAPEGYVGQLKRAIYGARKASRLLQDFVMKTCAAVFYFRLKGHPTHKARFMATTCWQKQPVKLWTSSTR